jgi:hypothetical protein
MNRKFIAYVGVFAIGVFVGAASKETEGEKKQPKEPKLDSKDAAVVYLDLLKWSFTARDRGFTMEQIREKATNDVKFIQMIRKF